jgi:hypothetical protein
MKEKQQRSSEANKKSETAEKVPYMWGQREKCVLAFVSSSTTCAFDEK